MRLRHSNTHPRNGRWFTMAILITSNNTDPIPLHPINNDLRTILLLLRVVLGIPAAILRPSKFVAQIKELHHLHKGHKSHRRGKRASLLSPVQIL